MGNVQTPLCFARCFCPQDKNILPPLRSEQALETRACLNILKDKIMTRRKPPEDDKKIRLTHPIRTRVTETVFDRLTELQKNSSCQTIGEVARMILSRQKINCFYRDITMNAPMEELTSIRKELKAIGVNINQVTRNFNTDKAGTQREYNILKIASLYKKVDEKVDILLALISKLTEKWLQE